MARLYLALTVLWLVSSCTFLSDKQYVQEHPNFWGVRRVAVFLQRWPVYLQMPGQSAQDADFIKETTQFLGPWEPAAKVDPRALDVQDIDDSLMRQVLLEALTGKGYRPFLAQTLPGEPNTPFSAALMMAQYQALDPGVEAFLFCFYTPALFLSHPLENPAIPTNRAFSLQEIVPMVSPGSQGLIWAGPRAALAPKNSVSHAFIYLSLTMFKALDWQPILQVAGSQAGGRSRPWIPQCPPGPTDEDYWADPRIIQNLMVSNLKCRLRHLIPNAM